MGESLEPYRKKRNALRLTPYDMDLHHPKFCITDYYVQHFEQIKDEGTWYDEIETRVIEVGCLCQEGHQVYYDYKYDNWFCLECRKAWNNLGNWGFILYKALKEGLRE